MNCTAEQILNEALAAWDWNGQVAGALRYGAGHINDTFCVYVQDEAGDCVRYILQRINTNTFTDPDGLMENICGVTGYLRKVIEEQGGDPMRETMNVVYTREGKPYYADSDGGAWRVYTFVEGTVCLQKVEQPEDFYESAVAFGNFQRQLAGYDASTLHETIARFHDTANRYANRKCCRNLRCSKHAFYVYIINIVISAAGNACVNIIINICNSYAAAKKCTAAGSNICPYAAGNLYVAFVGCNINNIGFTVCSAGQCYIFHIGINLFVEQVNRY